MRCHAREPSFRIQSEKTASCLIECDSFPSTPNSPWNHGRMTTDDVKARLGNIAQEIFDDDDLVFSDDLGRENIKAWDSLGHIRMIAAVEEAFGITFTIDEIEGVRTMGQIVALIDEKA